MRDAMKTVKSSWEVKDAHSLVITGYKTANVIPITILTRKCVQKCTHKCKNRL